jgi:hypothetical protein
MRRSIPKTKTKGNEIRNPNSKSEVILDKRQPSNLRHQPFHEMQYGCSRITGAYAGGYMWNPPEMCEAPRIEYSALGDSWVNISFCTECVRYRTKTCQAYAMCRAYNQEGYLEDTPKTRAAAALPARKKSRRTT